MATTRADKIRISALALCAVGLISSGIALWKNSRNLEIVGRTIGQHIELKRTTAYYCGFLSGQKSIMSRMPHSFEPDTIPDEMEECKAERENAARHGFTEGKAHVANR